MSRVFYGFVFLLFSFTASAQVDTLVGCKAPKEATRNDRVLAHALCDSLTGERQKANAIYNWITHNIAYDLNSFLKGSLKHDEIEKVMARRKGVCEGYSYLFTDMCREVGLNAVTIEGYARDWMFDDGDKLYVPRHAWNAVMIDGRWQLVDATWGAGGYGQGPGWLRRQMNKLTKHKVLYGGKMRFAFHYDPAYFLQDPQTFRLTHLPADPLWQLTDTTMPIEVFEAGERAVAQFNEKYSHPAQKADQLALAAKLPDVLRVYEYAGRAHKYNPNFCIPVAIKYQVDAEVQLSDTLNARDPMPIAYRYAQATTALKQSTELFKEQQKGYDKEGRVLKKKNKTKNTIATRCIRELRNDNKRLVTTCDTKSRAATAKEHLVLQKQAALKRTPPITGVAVKKGAKHTAESAAHIAAIQDSATARSGRLAALQQDAAAKQSKLDACRELNERRIDSLNTALVLSDSLLVQETIERIRMHDDYDVQIITPATQFKELKYRLADSLQRRYMQGYDTLVLAYEQRRSMEATALTLCKTALRQLVKYDGSTDAPQLATAYTTLSNSYRNCLQTHAQHLAEYDDAIRRHTKICAALVKVYHRQDLLTDYMEHAEQKRNELEESTLVKKDAFNKRENVLEQQQVEKAGEKAKKLAARKT